MVKLAILGSTGSVGQAALDVVAAHPDLFRVVALVGGKNVVRLAEQTARFRPEFSASAADAVAGLIRAATWPSADRVLIALAGLTGLRAAFAAAHDGKSLAVANKELLVAAGPLLLKVAREVIPVDSEHAALHRLLAGLPRAHVSRVVLTASGGPFRGRTTAELARATVAEALQHPTWRMGKKISVDSATLMNKALEVIEAAHLFGLQGDQIDVVVHPESLVHAMVELVDGSLHAAVAMPDMRAPLAYALAFPSCIDAGISRLDWTSRSSLHFEPVDARLFPALSLGYDALRAGGSAPIALSAANDVAVQRFLGGQISFLDIVAISQRALASHRVTYPASVDEIEAVDLATRQELRAI